MDTAPIVDTACVQDLDGQHDPTNGTAYNTRNHPERPRQSSGTGNPAYTPRLHFGPYRLLPAQRLLLEHDKPVLLGSRALDILIILIERPGELVTREQLLARVWPNTTVVEGNLDSPETVRRVFENAKEDGGIWGVFCVLVFPGIGANADGEERQGKARTASCQG